MLHEDAVEVLLVEDSEEDAELTIRAFKKRNLATLLHRVEDGAAALDYLLGSGPYEGRPVPRRPKVVLLDLKLPKIGGLEVLRRLREDERTKNLPVVVITSSREDRDLEEAYRYGVNSYVVKPVDFEQFSKAMGDLGLYWILVNQSPNHP